MITAASLRILLLQVRDHAEPERQEIACFCQALGIPEDALERLNLVRKPRIGWGDVADADLLILGGAGRHTVTKTYPFTDFLDDVLLNWIEADRPFFGSCYGHHVLVRLFGGDIVEDKLAEEIGTFEIETTDEGRRDPVFSTVPPRFLAQLGHHDRPQRLPEGLLELAKSERCANQALRVAGKPAYSTQFHPELTVAQMEERLLMYRESYLNEASNSGISYEELSRTLRPTPHASTILERFVEAYF